MRKRPWHDDFQRLLNNLRSPGHRQYRGHLRQLYVFILKTTELKAIVDTLTATTRDFDVNRWYAEKVGGRRNRGTGEWPEGDAEKIRACWELIETCVTPRPEGRPADPGGIAAQFAVQQNADLDDQALMFTQIILRPFVEYVQARINAHSEVIYLLERYRRRFAWFDQVALYDRYSTDTARGEAGYDTHLRSFLFDQGIEFPFSKPRSASGDADIVADIEGEDPLIAEVKLYDGGAYGVPYVAKGLRQAIRYAHDYGKSVGHLVIFNLTDERLELPTDDAGAGRPERLIVEGVTVFLFVIQAKPLPSASTDKKARVRRVERDDLVKSTDPTPALGGTA